MPKSSPNKSPEPPTKANDAPASTTQPTNESKPEPQLRWIAVPHDGLGEIVIADLPDDLGVLLKWEGVGLCCIPHADISEDNKLIKHPDRKAIEVKETHEARLNAPLKNPRQVAEEIKAKEMAAFLPVKDKMEAKNVPADTSTAPYNTPTDLRSPLAPKLPDTVAETNPNSTKEDPKVFGSGNFRIS